MTRPQKQDGQKVDENKNEMLQAQLKDAVRELQAIQRALDASTIVAITDRQGKITYVNEAFCEISQYSREELIGQTHRIINSGYHPKSFFKEMWQTIASGKVWRGEIKNKAKDGSYYWVFSTIVPFLDEQGTPYQYVSIRTDITDLKQQEQKIQYLAYHDELTALTNRRYVNENFGGLIDEAREYGHGLAIMFVDIARFKNINDTIGHNAGDMVLKEVAHRLQTALHDAKLVARMGGDEFLVVLAGEGRSQIEDCLNTLEESLSRPVQINNREYVLSANIGISWYPDHGQDMDSLLKKADLAMYQAKKEKKMYVWYEESMYTKIYLDAVLEHQLAEALRTDQFSISLQPQYHLKSRRIQGVEALIRWHHPHYGRLSPGQFLPVAAELGLMVDVDMWVLRHSCLLYKQCHLADDANMKLAVNLSMASLELVNLPELILKVLKDTQFDPGRLQVEITEQVLVREMDQALSNIRWLKELGISIALDDFGTGYSSLSYLHQLSPDYVKIDRSLVAGMDRSAKKQVIVEAVTALCRKLDIQTLAEGVENEQQIHILLDFGCMLGQSFYLSPPLDMGMSKDGCPTG